jgi:ADP-ribosyl-[dinitrogen reductase] hydrolase
MEVTEIHPSWKEHPMDDPHRIEILLKFTPEQYEKLKRGLEPEQMEDKWLIYYEHGWLHFCRSWTRFEIYKAKLVKDQDEYVMKEFWVERNPKKWANRSDDHDRNILYLLVAWGLLGIDVRGFYSEQQIKAQMDSVNTWSIFGRMYFTPDLFENDKSSSSTKKEGSSKQQLILGAIIGDIIGSVYEWHNVKTTDFELFSERTDFTDDSVMTIATMDGILNGIDYTTAYQTYGRKFPHRGYGGFFNSWIHSDDPQPYNSFGNGSAMRVSPVGWAYDTLDEVLYQAKRSAEVTHNHPEGIKGAQANAAAVFLARTGSSKADIRKYIQDTFGYDLERSIDDIRPVYKFNETCQKTVPEAIIAFLESKDYESAIRLAVSIGGDSDTVACITGGIAEAFYKEIPDWIVDKALGLLPEDVVKLIEEYSKKYRTEKNKL